MQVRLSQINFELNSKGKKKTKIVSSTLRTVSVNLVYSPTRLELAVIQAMESEVRVSNSHTT